MPNVKNKITDNVTLGAGTLWINGIDVGHLKGTIELRSSRETVDFKPADMTGVVKRFVIRESMELVAQTAELRLSNLQLALGLTSAINASTTFPSISGSCSYEAESGSSWDYMTVGGEKSYDEVCVLFEHTRPNDDKVVVVFYKAQANADLTVPFNEEDFTLHDFSFMAIADATRSVGDQFGVIAVQVQ
jgi:hypothetical protein